jgi:hypothetical protein
LSDRSLGSLFVLPFGVREAFLHDGIATLGHDLAKIPEEQIVVLLQETGHVVSYVSRIMNQAEFLRKGIV